MKEFGWKSLHLVTRLLIIAAILRLAGDVLTTVQALDRFGQGVVGLRELLASLGHAYGYSLLFFSSAATVELLFRIWRELRELRLAGVRTEVRGQAGGESAS